MNTVFLLFDSLNRSALAPFDGTRSATNGHYRYFRYPENMEAHDLFEYRLMPMHNRALFKLYALEPASLYRGFSFTKKAPMLKQPPFQDEQIEAHKAPDELYRRFDLP